MPVFTSQLGKLNYASPPEAVKAMAKHLRYIQEQLEYTLMNLDSSNVTEINTDETAIVSGNGGSGFSGNSIVLRGEQGESFRAGSDEQGLFRFALSGKNGEQIIYFSPEGELVITEHASLSIDCGEW